MNDEDNKLHASLSLDLDDKWSYLKTHGNPEWKSYPSYLDIAIPRILNIFEKFDIKITFFFIGKDATFERNRDLFSSIVDARHDIGNHSFQHDPWLHLYTEHQIHRELEKAEDAIEDLTGVRPVGFRGPGFSFSPTVIKVLIKRGYLYDASKFPTYLAPLARLYFLMTSKADKEEMKKRKKLFGSFKDGFKPIKAYWWEMDEGRILEIPVTTMPIFKVPIHFSYIMYLASFNKPLAISYLKTAVFMFKIMNVPPSILLHPLDFLGSNDFDELSFFPAMRMEKEKKLEIADEVFSYLYKHFRLVSMREHADIVINGNSHSSGQRARKNNHIKIAS